MKKKKKEEPKGKESDRKEPYKDTSGSYFPIPTQKGTLRNKMLRTQKGTTK